MNKIILTALMIAVMLPNANAQLRINDFAVEAGTSHPIGEAGDVWSTGYHLGLSFYIPFKQSWNWGLNMSYDRWKPNAEQLLGAESDDLRVEISSGSKSIGSMSALIQYTPDNLNWLMFDGGAALHYLRWFEATLRGSVTYEDEDGAGVIVYEAYFPGGSELAAGVYFGISMEFFDRIKPRIRYNYVFSADTPTEFIQLNVGLLAR